MVSGDILAIDDVCTNCLQKISQKYIGVPSAGLHTMKLHKLSPQRRSLPIDKDTSIILLLLVAWLVCYH